MIRLYQWCISIVKIDRPNYQWSVVGLVINYTIQDLGPYPIREYTLFFGNNKIRNILKNTDKAQWHAQLIIYEKVI